MGTQFLGIVASLISLVSAVAAADWNEWRGPQRNGLVENSPPLLTNWPAQGPSRIWLSEDAVPGEDSFGGYRGGGYSSVVVADGRVYCLYVVPRSVKLETRTLTDQKLTSLGWTAKKPPADLLATAEVARVSADRLALTNAAAIQGWAQKWIDALPQDQKRPYGAFILNRLKLGKDARDLVLLDKLVAITNKPFANQEALDTWFAENGIEGEFRKAVQAQIPDNETHRDTGLICLDAATGKTVWKKLFTGGLHLPIYENVPSSGTPCVANGKVYLLGTSVEAFCLDARTGEKIWSAKIGSGKQRDSHCSFIVADGVAAVAAQPAVGLNADTGEKLWSHELKESWSAPGLWRKDGKPYFIFRDAARVVCIDPKPGTILWSMKDITSDLLCSGGTPVVEGDRLVLIGKNNVRLFNLSAEKAEPAWSADCPTDYCCSPTVYQGHVYVFGRGGASCISLESGKIVWQDKEIKTGCYCTPIVADGKCLIQGASKGSMMDGILCMTALSPEKSQPLLASKVRQVLCTTPALVDGRLYCRLVKNIACFDLRSREGQ